MRSGSNSLGIMPDMKESLTQTHQQIQKWYQAHGRVDLPWRTTSDPYHIYLSEVMLQQTQVATVLERYYAPFLKKFPSFDVLASASLDEVLKMWEGLGYYNRAKNLHRTAQIVAGRYNGILPSELDALQKLPGIGPNTAHALAAFAFKQPVPVMEANVKRILCRLYKLEEPTVKQLWELAYKLVDRENPFAYNQAMMDIGAMVCLPKNPQCQACPLASVCQGKKTPVKYPQKQKRTIPTRQQYIMVSRYNNKLALYKREGRFLHGLWGFKEVEVPLCAAEYIGEVSHAYTHFKLHCKVYLYDEVEQSDASYFFPSEIVKLAISKVDEKILNLYLDTIHKDQ